MGVQENIHTLAQLETGQSARITVVGGEGALRQHFLDMGLIPGAEVTLVKFAPMGDPMELRIHGYELTLRLADAAKIDITPVRAVRQAAAPAAEICPDCEHPGLGEGGRFHIKAGEHPLPEETTLTFALAGNQNCGKTTLFNQLTGANQHVGNFPGVTVDRKSGAIREYPNTEITDLPGIYSMSPYTSEEIVTRQFIINEKPTGIINIVDATNIERNLYLTMQLLELDVPMVLALNMMDEVRGNGGSIRINEMEAMLGIPVVPISAAKNEGVDELVRHAVHVAKYQEKPGRTDFCGMSDHGGAVHRCLHAIMHLIADHAEAAGIPVRFAATKLVEGDHRVLEALALDQNEREMLEHIILQMETERGLDRSAAIADMRFSFIKELVDATVVKPHESREHLRSQKIDRFLTGKYTAIPAFIGIMGLVFFLTFNVIGAWLQGLLEEGIARLTELVNSALMVKGGRETLATLDAAARGQLIEQLVLIMDTLMRLEIPMQMATGSVAAGVLGQAALRKGVLSRGDKVDYPPLRTWTVPKGWGRVLGATLAALYVLTLIVPSFTSSMFYVFTGVFEQIFALQGIAAVCYYLNEKGKGRVAQGLVFALGYFAIRPAAILIGIADQTFDVVHRREKMEEETPNPFDPRTHDDK